MCGGSPRVVFHPGVPSWEALGGARSTFVVAGGSGGCDAASGPSPAIGASSSRFCGEGFCVVGDPSLTTSHPVFNTAMKSKTMAVGGGESPAWASQQIPEVDAAPKRKEGRDSPPIPALPKRRKSVRISVRHLFADRTMASSRCSLWSWKNYTKCMYPCLWVHGSEEWAITLKSGRRLSLDSRRRAHWLLCMLAPSIALGMLPRGVTDGEPDSFTRIEKACLLCDGGDDGVGGMVIERPRTARGGNIA